MSKKPYRFEKQEWLELSQRKDWNDPRVNPDDLAEYSEFQRPYALPSGEDSYSAWEWGWPDITFPDIPPIITPDPVPNPCNAEDDCIAVGIVGPEEMDCGDCYTWTHVHVITSCEPAWWMAYGSWTLDPGGTECYLLFSGPIMATVCCPDDASGTLVLRYEGPLECSDSVDIIVTCDEEAECCEDFSLTGSGTVNAGETWVGTVSPACPCAECTVVSNSGCSLSCIMNGSGSEVSVALDGGDCGGFTVTVTDKCVGEECTENSDSLSVRINGGAWHQEISNADLGLRGCDVCGQGGGQDVYFDNCIQGIYKYGGPNPPGEPACEGTWFSHCKGPSDCGGSSGSQPPCMSKSKSCGGPFPCTLWSWWRCDWICEC